MQDVHEGEEAKVPDGSDKDAIILPPLHLPHGSLRFRLQRDKESMVLSHPSMIDKPSLLVGKACSLVQTHASDGSEHAIISPAPGIIHTLTFRPCFCPLVSAFLVANYARWCSDLHPAF